MTISSDMHFYYQEQNHFPAMDSNYFVRWTGHRENLGQSLTTFLSEQSMTDVTLVCQNSKTLRAHRIILCAASTYFLNLFKCPTVAEHSHPVIVLKDVDSELMEILLNFIYSGEISIDASKIDPLLKLGSEFEILGFLAEMTKTRRQHESQEKANRKRDELESRVQNLKELSKKLDDLVPRSEEQDRFLPRVLEDLNTPKTERISPTLGAPMRDGDAGQSPSNQPNNPSVNTHTPRHSPVETSRTSRRSQERPVKRPRFSHSPPPQLVHMPQLPQTTPPPPPFTAAMFHRATASPLLQTFATEESYERVQSLLSLKALSSTPSYMDRKPMDLFQAYGAPYPSFPPKVEESSDEDRQTLPEDLSNQIHQPVDILTMFTKFGGKNPLPHMEEPCRNRDGKRYKKYSPMDIKEAVFAVERGLPALEAARKFNIPPRTLYDKIRKMGIKPRTKKPSRIGSPPPQDGLNNNQNRSQSTGPFDQNTSDYVPIEPNPSPPEDKKFERQPEPGTTLGSFALVDSKIFEENSSGPLDLTGHESILTSRPVEETA